MTQQEAVHFFASLAIASMDNYIAVWKKKHDFDEESELHEEIIGWETKVTFQEKCIKQKCVQTILVLFLKMVKINVEISKLIFQSCDNDPNDPDMHEAWKQEGLHESIVDDDDDEDFRDSIDVSVIYKSISL